MTDMVAIGACNRENCPSDAHDMQVITLLGKVYAFRFQCKVCAAVTIKQTLDGYDMEDLDDDE